MLATPAGGESVSAAESRRRTRSAARPRPSRQPRRCLAAVTPGLTGTLREYLQSKGVKLEPQKPQGFKALDITLPVPTRWTQVPDPNVPDAFAVIADRRGSSIYTSNAQVVVYKLVGNFDPKEAITHGFVDSQQLLAWQTTNASMADFGGFPSSVIEGTYRDGDMTLNTSRRNVIATSGTRQVPGVAVGDHRPFGGGRGCTGHRRHRQRLPRDRARDHGTRSCPGTRLRPRSAFPRKRAGPAPVGLPAQPPGSGAGRASRAAGRAQPGGRLAADAQPAGAGARAAAAAELHNLRLRTNSRRTPPVEPGARTHGRTRIVRPC